MMLMEQRVSPPVPKPVYWVLMQAEQFVDALSNRHPKQQQQQPPGPAHQQQQEQQDEQHKQQGQEQHRQAGQQEGGVALGSLVRVLWEQGKFTGRVTKYNPDTVRGAAAGGMAGGLLSALLLSCLLEWSSLLVGAHQLSQRCPFGSCAEE